MPNDVTAQAFREAAAIAKRDGDAAFAGLFLAAAEQREQVDVALARIAKLDEWLLGEVVLTERDNAIAQIATLKDRVENLKFDMNLVAAQLGITKREEIEPTVRKLLAERDEARAKLYEHTVTSVTAGANPQKDGGMSAPLFHVNCLVCGERWSLQTWKRDEADKLHPIGKCINAVMRTK